MSFNILFKISRPDSTYGPLRDRRPHPDPHREGNAANVRLRRLVPVHQPQEPPADAVLPRKQHRGERSGGTCERSVIFG